MFKIRTPSKLLYCVPVKLDFPFALIFIADDGKLLLQLPKVRLLRNERREGESEG